MVARSAKFSLFDPAKEMVYIEMSKEEKQAGKAAVDLVGSQVCPLDERCGPGSWQQRQAACIAVPYVKLAGPAALPSVTDFACLLLFFSPAPCASSSRV